MSFHLNKYIKLTDMDNKKLILKAVEYVNDIPARVEEFLTKQEYTKEPEPEFKVGQYYLHSQIDLIRIIGVDKKHIDFQFVKSEQKDFFVVGSHFYCDLSIATPAEIEGHLQKICVKYVGKEITGFDDRRIGIVNSSYFNYNPNDDQFWMRADNDFYICVYSAGKWAEIIPDKKKLPRTKEELYKVLLNFHCAIAQVNINKVKGVCIDDFLKEYED